MSETSSVPLLANVGPAAQIAAGALPVRLLRLVGGLWLFGVSIALMVEGGIGAAPWDVLHTGVTKHVAFSLGTVIVVASGAVLLAWIPIRQMPGLGTVLNAALVGPFAGLALDRLPTPEPLAAQLGFAVGGTVLCAFATALYVGAQLGPGPRDGLMTGLSRHTGWSIRSVRTGMELVVLSVGVVLGGSAGVGTVLFALGVGPLTQAFLPHLVVPLVPPRSTPRPADQPPAPSGPDGPVGSDVAGSGAGG